MLASKCTQTCRISFQILAKRQQSALASFAINSIESMREESIFTEDHVALRQSLRKIIDNEINPFVEEWERHKLFPAHQVMKVLGSNGFLGVNKPVDKSFAFNTLSLRDVTALTSKDSEYGGLGLDFSYSVAVAEELGNINCGGVPMAIGVQTDMATPALARFGSDELKRQFLVPTIAGDYVSCLGVSEPGAGSDVANIKTTAVKDGDDYVINGAKMWTTSGMQADWMCLLANTGGEGGIHFNKSLLCLPMDTKGVHRAKSIEKIGMHSSDTAQIFFEDVRIPQKYLIGEEGQGFTYQMLQFQEERLFAIAGMIVPLQKCIAYTIDYCRDRKIFGKPILDNQVVHFRMAELATEVELLRSLLYRSVAMYMQGNDVTKLASMGKLKAGRLARETTDACLQYWGGMGYTDEVPISRFFRDSKYMDGNDVTKLASMGKLKSGRLVRELSDACLQYLGGMGVTPNLVSRTYLDGRLLSIGGGADEVMLSIICKYMGTLPKQK